MKIDAAHLSTEALEVIFSYLSLSELSICAQVCSTWNDFLSGGNSSIWRQLCAKELPLETLNSSIMIDLPSYRDMLRAYHHSWNPVDCSINCSVKPNGLTMHRHPVAQSSDGVRGKVGFTSGRHCWEVWWEGPLGTVAVIGIAAPEAPLQHPGYVPLIGYNQKSWGWNLLDNHLVHDGENQRVYPSIDSSTISKYEVGEKIRVILDCERRTLAFERNHEFLGIAVEGLPEGVSFHPAVSAVYGNTEVSMVYLGYPMDG